MWLTTLSVRRPLAVLAVFLAIGLAGLLAYNTLPINQFPNVNIPVVTVLTTYPGAGPEEVELQVTRLIEDAVAGLNDLDYVTSVSSESVSQVTIVFTEHANSDLIGTTVERQVNSVLQRLPADADRPSVLKLDFSQQAIIQLALVSDSLPPEEQFRVADEVIRPELERTKGVAQVSIVGGRQQEVRVEVDPFLLGARGVSLAQVQTALAQANQSVPGGSIAEQGREYTLRLYGLFARPEDLAGIAVGGTRDAPVRLQDIATVHLGASSQTQISRVNHRPAIVIGVTKQSGANVTDIADGVRAALPHLRASLPVGSDLVIVQDTSDSIRGSISGVQNEILSAVALTAIVLLLFLHRFRVSAIVLISIPMTLLATLAMMRLMGFSLNLPSTLGLTLTVGILVDDSIVVLENILRHLSHGEPPADATIKGRAEIGLAAIAITFVDVVVFAPVGLVSGQVGSILREFGFTIAAATLFSLVVSFTLTPMIASHLLTADDHGSTGGGPLARFGRRWDAGFARLQAGYRAILTWSLTHRPVVLLGAGATVAAGVVLVMTGLVSNEFFPATDQGFLFVSTEAPPGTSLERHDAAMRQIEERLLKIPEVVTVTSSVGGGASSGGFTLGAGQARFGNLTVELTPRSSGRRDVFTIVEDVRGLTRDVPGVVVRVDAQGGGASAQPVSVRLQGPDSARLAQLAGQVETALSGVEGLRDVTNSAAVGVPELRITVDRSRAEDLGISASSLGQTIRASYAGVVATKYRRPDGRQIDVRLLLNDEARGHSDSLASLPIQTNSGGTVRLGQVATIEQVLGPAQIDRRNRSRLASIGASLAPDAVLGQVLPQVTPALAKIQVPQGYTMEFGGNAAEQSTAFGQLFAALGASILLAYLLMVVLYNSFVYPLAILFALPMAVGGAVGALFLFHYSFSLFAMFGLILLVGLAIKNGILLIDRTNQNRHNGMTRHEALLEAGPTRLRPILMTSLTISMALLPMALKIGEGAELYAPLGAAALGGVVSSTVLTLVVVPVMYTLLDSLSGKIVGMFRWRPWRRWIGRRKLVTDPLGVDGSAGGSPASA
ncbi:MAG: hydrophobic/amphiphilic exporter (mainly bacteria), family [Chloroflexota bacterium]|jgi:HAE1 family hydrophobic/amphiphilic exporter-1|nr:hydrophobic/amphiphilic exporter (mainly bacteria), family [Chloroflexota bacterium]